MLVSMSLRIAALGMRFIFLLLAAKTLSAEEYTRLGGINSLVMISIYFAGFDLYINLSRRLNDRTISSHENSSFITNYCYSLLACSSIVLAVVYFLDMPFMAGYTAYILLIIVFEAIISECMRLLVATGKYIASNLIFLLKTCWIIPFVYMSLAKGNYTLEYCINIWLFWVFNVSLLSLIILKDRFYIKFVSVKMLDILLEFKSTFVIFISSLSFLAINNVDKIYLATKDEHGLIREYFFISSLISVAITVIYSGVINPLYKKVLYYRNDDIKLQRILTDLQKYSLVTAFVVAFLVWMSFDFFVNYLGFSSESSRKYLLLMSLNMILVVTSLKYHYYLFAKGLDKLIAMLSISTLLIVCTLMPFLYSLFSVDGVIYALLISSAFTLVSKWIFTKI
ncbi:lipopolysaccharide biosynthesis protein [Paraferrimonas haliotis]|uniref:lipopolysaccharide biosynthesis protein n=1 Tax=Paraferrimonas haliotis TaxID=2013866 RepID=UPI000BA9073F|nr:hypothetical protein [Paraferrimonas haliotis]